jgi:hypothetical protein
VVAADLEIGLIECLGYEVVVDIGDVDASDK